MINLKTLAITLVSLTLIGCATNNHQGVGGTESLDSLKQLSYAGGAEAERTTVSGIRKQALKETAMTIGAQSGLAWRSKQINTLLEKQAEHLDKIYDFNSMLMENNVLPPILVEGRDAVNQDEPDSLRFADRTYRIIKQSRFVTTAPHWREYMKMHFVDPERPNKVMLPRNKDERALWNTYVTHGWEQGISQANSIFEDSLAKLKQDYKGIVLYRILLAQHMVTKPFVAKTELGVTGTGDEMRINDKALHITALPTLRSDSDNWKPAVAKKEEKRSHVSSGLRHMDLSQKSTSVSNGWKGAPGK